MTTNIDVDHQNATRLLGQCDRILLQLQDIVRVVTDDMSDASREHNGVKMWNVYLDASRLRSVLQSALYTYEEGD